MLKIISTGVGAAAGAALTTVTAPVILPFLGAAGLLGAAGTGTAIVSLSGAALTSASCAVVTGTIAGTSAVIGTIGAASGAIVGYFSDKFGRKKSIWDRKINFDFFK